MLSVGFLGELSSFLLLFITARDSSQSSLDSTLFLDRSFASFPFPPPEFQELPGQHTLPFYPQGGVRPSPLSLDLVSSCFPPSFG